MRAKPTGLWQHKAGVKTQPQPPPYPQHWLPHSLCPQTTKFGFVLFCHKCCTVGFLILYLQILVFGYAKNKLCPD